VLVYAIDGPFFFGAVENFERALLVTHTVPQVLVLRLKRVPFMDITGLQALEEVIQKMQSRHVRVILCEANARVMQKLEATGLTQLVGSDGYFDTLDAALEHCRQADPLHSRRQS
jgi:SulP family sulfate permease